MRKTTSLFLLFGALGLVGCPTSSGHDSGPTPGHDAAVVPGEDTGVDSGPAPGMDSGVPALDVSVASLVDASATDHPADGTEIHLTGTLVALTARQVGGTAPSCTSSVWVGTVAGGDHSGIQVFESFTASGTDTCFTSTDHILPDSIRIGDAVTNVVGRFINFCPSGTACPSNTAQEISVKSTNYTGQFTSTTNAGTPVSTTVPISDIAGAMLSVGPRDLALQGAVVTIENTQIATALDTHNVMSVHATGATSPVMFVRVATYNGVGCQRSAIGALGVGGTLGNITGVLQYSFSQWVIVVRQGSDISGIAPGCPEAGMGSLDAGVDVGP